MRSRKMALSILAFVAIASILVTAGCENGLGIVTGSGRLETRTFQYGDFTRLEVGSAFDVNVTGAGSYSISITADDNLFEYIQVNKSGDTLEIGTKGLHAFRNSTLKASVSLPDLRGLSLSGATRGKVSGFSSSHPLSVQASGASNVTLDDLKVGNTEFEISGASKAFGSITMVDGNFDVSGASQVELEGSATNISIKASGASGAKLADLNVVNANANISGASNATVNASGQLDVRLSGASKFYYLGNPTLGEINVSGASTIGRK